MKNLNISFNTEAINLSDNESTEIKKHGFAMPFEVIFNQGLGALYPQGLTLSKGKVLSRIQKKLDALKSHDLHLELEEAEFDLVKEVFLSESVKFMPTQYRLVSIYVDSIEKAKLE